MSRREYDNEDVRTRPQRNNSRRRTKDRPDFSEATIGRVVAVDRGRITCVYPDGVPHAQQTTVVCVKARELGRKGVVVGDRVKLVGDLSGQADTLARLVELIERTTVLMRTADDSDPVERVIVANADQLAIVTSVTDPEPRTGLIDRALVAAFHGGLRPLLVLTKTDLKDPAELISNYDNMDLDIYLVNQKTGEGIEHLREAVNDHVTVFVGHSGVGKSTLVNALIPDANRVTGEVNDVTGRGKHTSTNAVALALPENIGWVIDTPGIRSFGLAHVTTEDIVEAFPEFLDGTVNCPRACPHVNSAGDAAQECALDDWVIQGEAGQSGADRLQSLRRLLLALQTSTS